MNATYETPGDAERTIQVEEDAADAADYAREGQAELDAERAELAAAADYA